MQGKPWRKNSEEKTTFYLEDAVLIEWYIRLCVLFNRTMSTRTKSKKNLEGSAYKGFSLVLYMSH